MVLSALCVSLIVGAIAFGFVCGFGAGVLAATVIGDSVCPPSK